MPADSTGSVFLWVNRNAQNFKSRDHKRVSKSYVQRAKHLKDWKHSKLRSSVSKTYFPWSFRPEGVSFGTTFPGNTRLPVGSEDASTFTTGTHQPVPWSYPMIGPDTYQQSAARYPSEISVATPTGREVGLCDLSTYPRLYDRSATTEGLSTIEAFSATEPSSSITPSPTRFEYDSFDLSIGSHTEVVDGRRGKWNSFNPSRLYPQACLCQYRQPTFDATSGPAEGPLGIVNANIDAKIITPPVDGSYGLEASAPCPSCGSTPIQRTKIYATMLFTSSMNPNLDYSRSALGYADMPAHQQTEIPTEASPAVEDSHYLPWTNHDDWEYGRQFRG